MMRTALPFLVLAALVRAGAATAAPMKERPLPEAPQLDLTWWRGFADPQLNVLLTEALAGNPDVKTAAARLGMAETSIGAARAERRPSLTLDANGGVRKYRPTASRQDPDINRPSLELSAGYELDLWGRLSQATQATTADWLASADDVTSAQLALAAEVATTWFSLRANTSLQEVLAERRDRAQSLSDLQRARLHAGLTTGDETLHQAAFIAQLEMERSSLVEEQARLVHRLAALRGSSAPQPQSFTVPPLAPSGGLALPQEVGTGLLTRRPDVRAVTLRLRAQQARVGVAHTATLPSLAILSKGFFAGDNLRELLRGGSLEGFLAAQISLPLLDGGRSRTRLESARAELTLAGTEYSAVVVRAFEESANAAAETEGAQVRLSAANQLLDRSRQAMALAEQRRVAGLTDRLAPLGEQNQLSDARVEVVRATLDLLKAQIALGQALALGAPPGN